MTEVQSIQVGNRVYNMSTVLGVGGFSEVRKGVDQETCKRVALKIMYNPEGKNGQELKNQLFQVQQEIKAMKKLNHANLIRLLGYDLKCKVGDRKAIVMVQQLAPQGELFDYLMYTKHFQEPEAIAVFQQLIAGLGAMHARGIAHRDLKPENLLFDNKFNLKIADFGFSKVFQKKEGHKTALNTELGTKGYMAPEIIKGQKYTEKCDIFASGVILFIMLAGFPPFQNADGKDWWFDKIMKKKYKLFWMAHERTAKFSNEAKDILQQMLAAREVDRLDIGGIQETAFWKKGSLTKDQISKVLKRRKVVVDKQKEEERKQATRDILIQLVIPEGDVMPDSPPVLLKDLLQNDLAEKWGTIDSKAELQSTLFGTFAENNTYENQLREDLRSQFSKLDDENVKKLAEIFSEVSNNKADAEKLKEVLDIQDEKSLKCIFSKLHTTKLGAIDDWEVASKFAGLDDVKLDTYDPSVFKSFAYQTKIGFGMLAYTVQCFAKGRGKMKIAADRGSMILNMPLKKKIALPVEKEDGSIVFEKAQMRCLVKIKISLYYDPATKFNVIVFENAGDAFTMKEFALSVDELTKNRRYYLVYFLESAMNPTEDHMNSLDVENDEKFSLEFVNDEEEVPAEN